MNYLKNIPAFKLSLFTIIFLTFSIGSNVFGNVFDGYKVSVFAPPTGGASAIKYLEDDVYAQSTVTLTGCPGEGAPINLGGGIWQIPRNLGTGIWCFQSPNADHLVSWTNPATVPGTVSYKWLANNNSTGFYNVKDFGAVGSGEMTDDTDEIRNAIIYTASKLGGTLYFPKGKFNVSDTISLPPGILIQGAMTKLVPRYGIKGATEIILTTTNKPLFRIGEDLENIRIKNIELRATSDTGTTGVEAVGKFTVLPNGGKTGSTQNITFENMMFAGFDKGLSVLRANSEEDWQFDYIRVESCQFAYNKTAGIYSEVENSDWNIISSMFYLPPKGTGKEADGIHVFRAMNMLVQSSFAGADTPLQRGGDFIEAKSISALQILNSQCESTTNSIVFGDHPQAGNLATTITVMGSIFADPIRLKKRSTYISSGNYYGGNTVNATDDKVMIYSTGDRFCEDNYFSGGAGTVKCGGPGGTGTTNIGFQGGKVVFQSGQINDGAIAAIPAKIGTDLNVTGDTDITGDVTTISTKPILKLTVPHSTGNGKTFLEMGEDPFVYRFSRDTGNGYLKFTGTQGSPWQGYIFDSPVRIAVSTLDQILNIEGVAGQGALIFCSDCNTGTSPCTSSSGASGALAVNTGSAWACK